jgi:hypothetical protein
VGRCLLRVEGAAHLDAGLDGADANVVGHEVEALCEDLDAVARDVELCARGSAQAQRRKGPGRTCLIALPMIRSDSPFEYTFAVSQVDTPRSHAAFSSGRACTCSWSDRVGE